MITYLKRLTEERDSLTAAATDLSEKAVAEDRDLTDTERSSLTAWSERCSTIDDQIREYDAQAQSQRAYASLRDKLSHVDDEPISTTSKAVVPETRSWGDLFLESPEFRNYQGIGPSGRVTVPFDFEERAEITLGGFPPSAVPTYTFSPAPYRQSTPLLGIIGKVTTNSNTVEYLTWAPNPPSAASVVAEGAAKPEATMTPTAHAEALQTYAHWKGITRQALEDIPQIRSIVEARLRGGLNVALETQAVTALTAASLTPVPADDLLTGIRLGIATVQGAGYAEANTALVNPADWAAIDLSVMGSTTGGPVSQSGVWGIRFVASSAVPAGTSFVGDFGTGLTLFTRGSAALYMSDSHADFFIRNVILILAEIRALTAVTETAALAEVTATVTP